MSSGLRLAGCRRGMFDVRGVGHAARVHGRRESIYCWCKESRRWARKIDAGHAPEEGNGVLASLLVGSGYGQCRTSGGQPLGIEPGLSSPQWRMRLKPGGKTCCKKRAMKVGPLTATVRSAAVVVGPHAQAHTLGMDHPVVAQELG